MRASSAALLFVLAGCVGPSQPDAGVAPGPSLHLMPSALAFGPVGAKSKTRTLVIRNVGSQTLKLGQLELIALNPQTSAAELAVTLGSPEVAAGGSTELEVRFTPASKGYKSVELTIASNDAVAPKTKLGITADAVDAEPCRYSVSPSRLSFGLIPVGVPIDLPLTITNTGVGPDSACEITSTSIVLGSDPAFTVRDAPTPRTLEPQETMTVRVRLEAAVRPATPTAIAGNLRVIVAAAPLTLVPLSASLDSSCLVITPNDASFGTVQAGCSSPAHTFAVYNTCSSAVTLQSLLPAGPEFLIVSAPGPVFNPGSAPATFSLRYSPINVGPHTGVLLLKAKQNQEVIEYAVTLNGAGDARGDTNDTFRQEAVARSTFFLSALPSLSTITVRVDGVPLDPVAANGEQVWSHDAVSNAVTFEPLHVPAGGATIVIGYTSACSPP